MAGYGVRLYDMYFEDWMVTFNVSGSVTTADVGKAVAIDASAANTVKLAADGDVVIGRLETYEDRAQDGVKLGTVALKFIGKLPIKSGATIIVGDSVVGAGSGEIKAAGAANNTRVFEVLTGYAVVVKE